MISSREIRPCLYICSLIPCEYENPQVATAHRLPLAFLSFSSSLPPLVRCSAPSSRLVFIPSTIPFVAEPDSQNPLRCRFARLTHSNQFPGVQNGIRARHPIQLFPKVTSTATSLLVGRRKYSSAGTSCHLPVIVNWPMGSSLRSLQSENYVRS